MIKRLLVALAFTFLTVMSVETHAQSLSNIHQLDVDKLTNAQVDKIKKEIDSKGLSLEQAGELAKAKGASEIQIMKLKARLTQPKIEEETRVVGQKDSLEVENKYASEELQTREIIKEEKSNIFGHSLFNSKNLTFNPSANIPIPSNYVIGIGDALSITVWGNSQQNTTAQVSTNGTINIPNVGVIPIAGQEFHTAKVNILNRLTAIYSEMAGDNPQTFADVTIGATKPIQVNIVGEANMPGTYSLPGTASVFNALFLSGGPNENGSFRNIQIIRENKVIQTVDVYDYLLNSNTKSNIVLRNQDVIYIPVYTTKVNVSSGFKRNSIFEIKQGETLADLFTYVGGLAENIATERLNIKRISPKGYEQLTANLDNLASFSLKNGDNLYANKTNLEYSNAVSIEGAVYEAGDYEFKEGMKLSDLINQAGGLIANYYAHRGLITRLDDKRFPAIIPFDVQNVSDGSSDVELKAEDQVLIKSIFDVGEAKFVKIEGEVIEIGEFKYQKNMTLKDLIFMAGGMKESASEASVEIARRRSYEEAAELSDKSVTLYNFDVSRNLSLSSEDEDFVLMPYDYIYIRKAPSYEKQRTVSILGEVKYPGKYAISSKDERISDLIQRAGGLTDYAYPDAAYMNRGLDEKQKELIRKVNAQKGEIDENIETKVELNPQLELQLVRILNNPGIEADYILKEGDQITIPIRKEEIWVNGAVLNPSGLAYESGGMKHYINAAGGFEARAKKHKTFVVYPNGSSASTKGFLHRNYPIVTPGSQIVVPLKPEREKTPASTWVALASTASSIAVSVIALFR
ncbi:MAG: SLBB domain-containing protein [Mangrovibacterium sp.]